MVGGRLHDRAIAVLAVAGRTVDEENYLLACEAVESVSGTHVGTSNRELEQRLALDEATSDLAQHRLRERGIEDDDLAYVQEVEAIWIEFNLDDGRSS